MRVLLVTGSYPPMKCGVGDYTYNLAQALAVNHEIQVGVLTSAINGTINKVAGVEIFPIIKKWGIAETLKVIKVIKRWSPDIVHIQYPTQGYGNVLLPWLLPVISFLMGKKVVQTWHEIYVLRNAPKVFLKSIIPGGLVFVRPRYIESLHFIMRWALWGKKTATIQNASSIPCVNLDETEKSQLKKQYLKTQKRLVVFSGFIYPHKGIELLFEIANPATDQIVIAGEDVKETGYLPEIIKRVSLGLWSEKVTFTGFLPAQGLAALLAVADAVILPFRNGAGEWNTSIHAAVLNRAFVITTSLTQRGYDRKRNIYFTKVDDIQEMKSALANYAGKRRDYDHDIDRDQWQEIADRHCLLYEDICG
ncbi:MAG: glycosyltransferase family 4 protein [Candidatus Omnitrophica bacterium]|jgi:glycosyltransferase involved in cell wall biosynthesis|nr:glycosyltransferase family 4 protein [Candidatus Omnitrophota bacterium]